MQGSLAIGEITLVNCCFPEHPQKYCHDDVECITRTVNKTLEYVSNTPPALPRHLKRVRLKMDVMTLPSVGGE